MDILESIKPEQVLYLPVLWISVICHEVAHAYAAYWGGDDTAARHNRLTLNPMAHLDPIGTVLIPILMILTTQWGLPLIGWAKPVPVISRNLKSPRWKIIVALAGVTVNLSLAILAAVAMKILFITGFYQYVDTSSESMNYATMFFVFLQGMITVNIVLMVFNLIPIPPLDGSHIWLYFIRARNTFSFKLFEFMERYGFFILIMLMAVGVFDLLVTPIIILIRDVIFKIII